jgi:acyl carrier protein
MDTGAGTTGIVGWLVVGAVTCEPEPGGLMKVQDTVVETIADVCSVDVTSVSPESRLDSDLGIDEMAVIELNIALEDEFNIKIQEHDMSLFETVGDIIDYIERVR